MRITSSCIYMTILYGLLISFPSIAQKNRPVLQDAEVLIKILNRDYYLLNDPETRLQELQNDRKTVVSIFKAYTADDFQTTSSSNEGNISNYQWEIRNIRQKITVWNAAPPQAIATDIQKPNGGITLKLQSDLKTNLKSLELELYTRDDKMLKELSTYYKKDNDILSKMTDQFILKFKTIKEEKNDPFASNINAPQIKKSLGLFNSGGLTFTQVIDGLATFMANRIKEELAMQIFDKIKYELSEKDPVNDQFLELKLLLPSTTDLLITIAPEQYTGVLNSLKESIETDLSKLMINLPKLQKSVKVQKLVAKHPEIELAFLGLQLINDLNKVKTPIEMIFILESSEIVDRWGRESKHQNFVNTIKFASLMIYSLTEDVSDKRYLVSRESWVSLYEIPDFYNLYLGFFIQQDIKYFNITYNDGTSLNSLLKDRTKVERWYDLFAPKINNLLEQAYVIESQIDELSKKKNQGGTLSTDSIVQTIRSSITFLDSTFSFADFALANLGKDHDIGAKSRLYFSFARAALDIYSDIGSKRYFNALSKAVDLTSLLQSEIYSEKKDQINFIISKIKEVEKLQLILTKEIDAGKISSVTLEKLKDLSTNIKEFCGGCTAFSEVLELKGDLTTSPEITKVVDLKSFLQEEATTAYFIAYYESLFESILRTNGLETFSLPKPGSGITTINDYWQFLSIQSTWFITKASQNPDVLKIINFLMTVSRAEDAEALADAIEAIVLPPGSAIIKRESALNISLNGFAGFFGGVERVYENNSNAASVAFAVPIGIAISKSFGKQCTDLYRDCKRSGSWSLFLSAIDIGAFTAVRFKDGDQALPEIKFKNIFAPGAHIIYGIPKSSFSIGAGVQLGPFLRKVEGAGSTTTINTTSTVVDPLAPNTIIVTNTTESELSNALDEKAALRFGLSVLIDIPLLNFYTKSKGYKR